MHGYPAAGLPRVGGAAVWPIQPAGNSHHRDQAALDAKNRAMVAASIASAMEMRAQQSANQDDEVEEEDLEDLIRYWGGDEA